MVAQPLGLGYRSPLRRKPMEDFMKCLFLLLALLNVPSVHSDDLAKMRLPPRLEPQYVSQPAYLLLVFGQEASTAVWVVADAEHVYIDRNANGDLTDKGERVAASTVQKFDSPDALFRELRTYDLGDIDPLSNGSQYKKLRLRQFRLPTEKLVARTPDEQAQIELIKQMPHFGGNISVHIGDFRQNAGPALKSSTENACVVHFDGPLSLSIDEHAAEKPLEIDPSTKRFPFQFRLGTEGLGLHAFAFTECPMEPKMRVVGSGEQAGKVELRYCGADYCTTIELPAVDISETIKLHISVPPFAGRKIEPLQLNVKLKPQ
jgi:hypothetical protein